MSDCRIDYGALISALKETARVERISYKEIADITGVPFPKVLHLVSCGEAKGLLAVHVINLARYTDTPLSALFAFTPLSDGVEVAS